jgi:hypothetical protein
MDSFELNISDIPHGHGLSFKKGVADGLLACRDHENTTHKTHAASYQRGIDLGTELQQKIGILVKD